MPNLMPSESTRMARGADASQTSAFTVPLLPSAGAANESPWSQVLQVLLLNWVMVVAVALGVVLATGAWLLHAVPIYEASARVQIAEQAPDYATLKDSAAASVNDAELVNTYVAIVEGQSLADKAITQLRLQRLPEFAGPHPPGRLGDVEQAFAKHLTVVRVPETRLIEIRFSSTNPALAAQVANVLANELIDFELQQNYDSAMKATSWLNTELQSLQGEVETADQNLVAYEQKNQIVNVNDRQTITTQKLSELNQDLTQAIADRIQKQAAYQAVVASGTGSAAGPSEVSDPLLPQLRQQRAGTAANLAQLETQFGPNYPSVRQLIQRKAALDGAIRNEVKRLTERLRQAYQAAVDREQLLGAAVARQTRVFNDLSQKMVQYQILKRQADSKRQLYDGLLQKQREAAVSAGITSSHINIVDPATAPLRPSSPTRGLDLAMSVMVGLLLGAGVVLVREQWDRTVRSPEVLEWLGAHPLLGLVPRFESPVAAASRLAPAQSHELVRRRSSELEAYRNLRTTLQLSAGDRAGRVIAVTSAMPGEGKSTCTANIAYTYAQTGEKVLIIDGDLRRPSQHLGFGVMRTPGLAELLLGEAGQQQTIVNTHVPQLFLLPAGRRVPNPSELLQSAAFAGLVRSLLGEFDRIFVDCTPMLGLSDGLLGIAVADTQLVVVRSGGTPKAAVRRLLAVCRQINLEVAGFILNGFSPESGYGYYGYHADYGAYHDETTEPEADEPAPALPARRN